MSDALKDDLKHIIKHKENYVPENYQNSHGGHVGHHGDNSFSSERIVNYKGKKVVIETTYKVKIDGEPLKAHVAASDDGTVHCHGLPNYSFASATSLVKNLIDAEGLAKASKNEIKSDTSKPCHNDNHADNNDEDNHHHHGHH